MSDSEAVGCASAYSAIRRCQRGRSLRSAASAMTGLHVAPTAPQPIAADSSLGVAESFHSRVRVPCAMRRRGDASSPVGLAWVVSLIATPHRAFGALLVRTWGEKTVGTVRAIPHRADSCHQWVVSAPTA